MTCSNCGYSNAEGASFCSNCGTALALRCPACSTPYDAGDSFCSNCGTRLDADAPTSPDDPFARYLPKELQAKLEAARAGRTMAGERRTITMLFADLQGSTAAAEQLDPEEWAEIVNGAFERLIRPVYRYEGTLARLMGDAILAFFGAPIAHEDDPERAVMAGLEMLSASRPYAREVRDRWGVDFDLRVGINTGLVVVGEVGSDLRVEYTALGDAVNVAARMEQTAAPGTLQVTGTTHRLVEGIFETEELEPVTAKGKSEPVAAYRVTGVRPRLGAGQGVLGRETSIVGRFQELSTLRGVIESVRHGKGQICTLIGEAGVGKSKLAGALKADLAADRCLAPWLTEQLDHSDVRWAEARCLSYDSSVPYAPFIDLFTGLFDIAEDEDAGTARSKITAAVDAVLDDPGHTATFLAIMLGLDPEPEMEAVVAELEPPALQRQVFSAVVSYIEACSAGSPGILVIEDLHWADAVSLALLEELMRATDRSMLAIIGLMRPYRDDPSWSLHETAARDFSHRYTSIRLEPLDDASARRMAAEILGDEDIDESLHSIIRARADGNPFFVEEILREMMESGALTPRDGRWELTDESSASSIPGTINGLLTARLDRLEDSAHHVLQLASVLGREFQYDELEGLAGDGLDIDSAIGDLMRRDLLVEQRRIPTRVYEFRHALIQETAYDTILLKTRRSLHGDVAEHLITRGAEPYEIARHLIGSGQRGRAIPHLAEAGRRAARAMSLADAIRHYTQALDFADDETDVGLVGRIHEGLGAAYTLIPDLTEASAAYQRMLEVGREHANPSLQITALNRLGFTTAALAGDYDGATTHLEEARRLAEQHDDRFGLAEYHMTSCMIATSRGDMEKAAAHDAETTRLGEETGTTWIRLGGLLQRVLSLIYGTEYEEAQRALEASKAAVADISNPNISTMLAMAEGHLKIRDGQIPSAWEMLRFAAEETAEIGSSKASNVAVMAGWTADMAGDPENALAMLAQARRTGEETGQLFNSAAAVARMAWIYADLGMDDPDDLEAVALELLEAPMGDMMASSVYADLGRTALIRGDIDRAETMFSTGVEGSSATRMHESSGLLLGLARVRIARGDTEAAQALIDEAIAFARERGMRFTTPIESLTLAHLSLALGQPDEAARILDDGALAAREMGMVTDEQRLRNLQVEALLAAGRSADAETAASAALALARERANRVADPAIASAIVEATRSALPDTEMSAGGAPPDTTA